MGNKFEDIKTTLEADLNTRISNIKDEDVFNGKEKELLKGFKKFSNGILLKIETSVNNDPTLSDEEKIEAKYKLQLKAIKSLTALLKASEKDIVYLQIASLKKILPRLKKFKESIVVGNDTIISDEYLKDNDYLERSNIYGKIEKADKIDDVKELIKLAQSEKLKGSIKGSNAWNNFFDDLSDKVNHEQLDDFNREVAKFKKDFPNLFKMEIDSSVMGDSLDESISSIEAGEYDEKFSEGVTFKVPIETYLGGLLSFFTGEKSNSKVTKDSPIEIGPFHNKQEALRGIYKLKLIFGTLQEQTNSVMDKIGRYYFNVGTKPAQWAFQDAIGDITDIPENYDEHGGVVGTLSIPTNLVGVLVALVYGTVGTAILSVGIPLWIPTVGVINGRRRLIDFISRHAGDRGWAKGVLGFGKWIEKGNTFSTDKLRKPGWEQVKSGNLFMKVFGATRSIVGLAGNSVLSPLSWTMGGTGKILHTAEALHLDAANLSNAAGNIVLVDGLNSSIGNLETNQNNPNNNAIREILTRARVLEFEVREAKVLGDFEKVNQLKKLWDKSALFSNTESFYIDMDEILHGADNTQLNNKKAEILRVAKRYGLGTVKGLTLIQSKKEGILKRHRENVDRTKNMLGEIYKNVTHDTESGKINIPESAEKQTAIAHIIANIDFGHIEDSEEIKRQELIKELDDRIVQGRMPGVKASHIPIEIQKIAEGYEPTFKIIEAITKKKQENITDDNIKKSLDLFKAEVLKEPNSWVLKSNELDEILGKIGTVSPIKNSNKLSNKEDFKKSGKELTDLDLKADSVEFKALVSIENYGDALKNTELEIKLGITQNVNILEVRQELEKYFTLLKHSKKSVDTTTPEFFFNTSQILSGKKYADRGTGNFGDPNNTLKHIINNYKDFGESEKNRRGKIINELQGKNLHQSSQIIKSIESHSSLKNAYGYIPDYQDIQNNITSEINEDFDIKKSLISQDLEELRSTIGEVDFGLKDGNTKSLEQRNHLLQQEINTLQKNIEQKMSRGADIVEKINLYESLDEKVVTLRQDVDELIHDVETHQGKPHSSRNYSQHNNISKSSADTPTSQNNKPKDSPEKILKRKRASAENLLNRGLIEVNLAGGDTAVIKDYLKRVPTLELKDIPTHADIKKVLKRDYNIDKIRSGPELEQILINIELEETLSKIDIDAIDYKKLPDGINNASDLMNKSKNLGLDGKKKVLDGLKKPKISR